MFIKDDDDDRPPTSDSASNSVDDLFPPASPEEVLSAKPWPVVGGVDSSTRGRPVGTVAVILELCRIETCNAKLRSVAGGAVRVAPHLRYSRGAPLRCKQLLLSREELTRENFTLVVHLVSHFAHHFLKLQTRRGVENVSGVEQIARLVDR